MFQASKFNFFKKLINDSECDDVIFLFTEKVKWIHFFFSFFHAVFSQGFWKGLGRISVLYNDTSQLILCAFIEKSSAGNTDC